MPQRFVDVPSRGRAGLAFIAAVQAACAGSAGESTRPPAGPVATAPTGNDPESIQSNGAASSGPSSAPSATAVHAAAATTTDGPCRFAADERTTACGLLTSGVPCPITAFTRIACTAATFQSIVATGSRRSALGVPAAGAYQSWVYDLSASGPPRTIDMPAGSSMLAMVRDRSDSLRVLLYRTSDRSIGDVAIGGLGAGTVRSFDPTMQWDTGRILDAIGETRPIPTLVIMPPPAGTSAPASAAPHGWSRLVLDDAQWPQAAHGVDRQGHSVVAYCRPSPTGRSDLVARFDAAAARTLLPGARCDGQEIAVLAPDSSGTTIVAYDDRRAIHVAIVSRDAPSMDLVVPDSGPPSEGGCEPGSGTGPIPCRRRSTGASNFQLLGTDGSRAWLAYVSIHIDLEQRLESHCMPVDRVGNRPPPPPQCTSVPISSVDHGGADLVLSEVTGAGTARALTERWRIPLGQFEPNATPAVHADALGTEIHAIVATNVVGPRTARYLVIDTAAR